MVEMNVEKKTGLWMGLLVLTMSIIYFLVSLGRTEWVQWIAAIWSFFLAGFLFSEAGVITYFRKKDYKKFGFGDAIVILTVLFATGILLNGLLLINFIGANAPLWLANFAGYTGMTAGLGGAILGIIHIFYPRFK